MIKYLYLLYYIILLCKRIIFLSRGLNKQTSRVLLESVNFHGKIHKSLT